MREANAKRRLKRGLARREDPRPIKAFELDEDFFADQE
jgi:hypothetical protein